MNFLRKIVKRYSKEEKKFYYDLKKILKFNPINLKIYKKAFTHSSSKIVGSDGLPVNYERLEFLGDAILGSVVSSYLYRKAPTKNEGYLTKMRSKVVSRENLNKMGRNLQLINLVESSVSKKHIGNNINGNILEALIGAIYLDKGYKFCHQFICDRIIDPYINIDSLEKKITSYKSLIIEWCQKKKKQYIFDSYEDTGKASEKHFSVKISIDGSVVAKGRSTSKKKAEEIASKRVFFAFQKDIEKIIS